MAGILASSSRTCTAAISELVSCAFGTGGLAKCDWSVFLVTSLGLSPLTMSQRLTSQELRSFVFLADNLVMVSSAESPLVPPDHPDLYFSSPDVYEIPPANLPLLDLNIDEAASQSQLTISWCLALPVLGKKTAREISLHSDPSPSWQHSGPAPFCTATNDRLIVVDYTFARRSTVSLFVRAETVLEYVRGKGTRGQFVPWLEWGPGTVYAVGDFGHEEAWAGGGFVHGMRYIHPHPARSRNPSNPLSIVVWDFHPRRVAAARSKEDAVEGDGHVVPRPRLPEELSEAWFPDGVGEPPFVIRQMSVPEDLRLSADIRFMIEEDTIIVHQTVRSFPPSSVEGILADCLGCRRIMASSKHIS